MKRPPGLWILLSAGVIWLNLQDVCGIRATELIFKKASTTSTEVPAASQAAAEGDETAPTTEPADSTNSTKPTLTGIPQIDYKWDPNLPKELNGYNLSDYPFYERVPDEEMDFKCDGLHDGFYASVPHKCQVYHHCLFGTRYDFLCANYTAFDQKTFICQFVSVVDCVNSKKFWHRNDALYEAASTTTAKPLVIPTTPPSQPAPYIPSGPVRRPAGGGGKRPLRRKRPQYDYYEYDDYEDDYYEERPRLSSRRKRPRPRPRPIYDDEYDDEYEDDRYERRRGSSRRNRRPYDRRPSDRKRNKDKKKDEYLDDDLDDRFEDEDLQNSRRDTEDRKKNTNEDDRRLDDRRYDKRKPSDERNEESDKRRDRDSLRKSTRKPADDYGDELPQNDESSTYDRSKKKGGDDRRSDKNSEESQPIIKPQSGTIYDRPRVAPKIKLPVPKNEANKYAYKPISTQAPPPSLEDEEYYDDYEEELTPKSVKNNRKPSDSIESRRPFKPSSPGRDEIRKQQVTAASRTRPQSSRRPDDEDSYESTERPRRTYTKRPKFGSNRDSPRPNRKKPAPVEDIYEDDYQEEGRASTEQKQPTKAAPTTTTTTTTTSTTTTTTTTPAPTTTTKEPVKEKPEPIVRIVKRPFLPSRGGNPFAARGLQPVGVKALDKKQEEIDSKDYSEEVKTAPKIEVRTRVNFKQYKEKPIEEPVINTEITEDYGDKPTVTPSRIEMRHRVPYKEYNNARPTEDIPESKPIFKPSPVIIKIPIRTKYVPPSAEAQEEFTPVASRQRPNYKTEEYSGPRTTQKPKVPERNPLDIIESEYDVTLNDALNPTLPNLPVRGYPTGFSTANDYTFSSFHRRPYGADSIVSPTNGDYVYQQKPVRAVPQTYQNTRGQFSGASQEYSGQFETPSGQNYRARLPQLSQTQAIYSSF